MELKCIPLTLGTAVMAIFPNVYVAMVMISSMGIISMSISYCPYALLGQYHEIKEVCTQTDNTDTYPCMLSLLVVQYTIQLEIKLPLHTHTNKKHSCFIVFVHHFALALQ